MAHIINNILRWTGLFLINRVVQLEHKPTIISKRQDMMEGSDITRVEEKIDAHIEQHNEDYKKLLWWIIAVLIALVGSTATWFISIGTLQEKVAQLEAGSKKGVTQQELAALIELTNVKFQNINEKLDDIKRGLNIR